MRDFPVFTTEHGVASITLKEVPYKGIAYIKIQDTREPEEFLRECVDFCKMTGAAHIYATGHRILEQYTPYTTIFKMSRARDGLAESDCALFPVTERTAEVFRATYNEKMASVPNASTMTRNEANDLVVQGGGYFVHKDGALLGIGIAREDTVLTVIGLKPGAGERVMLTLCGSLFSERIVLEVASTNQPALRLYERLGFSKVTELSCWYDVLTGKST